jgi:hypothetical protein
MSSSTDNQEERFDEFADRVVLPWIPPETLHLDVFRLNLVSGRSLW